MTRIVSKSATAKVAAFVVAAVLCASGQAQPPAGPDAEMAALQTRMKALQLQKQIDALTAQQQALEKQQRASTTPLTTDAEMAAAQVRMKVLQLQKQIEDLKSQKSALLNPPAPAPPVPPVPAAPQAPAAQAKPVSAEDAEIQRLEAERQRLLKEQEIERLRKENERLKTPPPSTPPVLANCAPQAQQGPNVKVQTPRKASAWACQHLGICTDDKPVQISGNGNGCPATIPGQATKQ